MDPILEEATRALEQFGPDFTMDYLSKRLRISKRTIYERYSSKEEIISTIFRDKIAFIYDNHLRVLNDASLSIEEKLNSYFSVQTSTFNTIGTDKVRRILESIPSIIDSIREDIQMDWELLRTYLLSEVEKGNLKSHDADTVVVVFRSLSRHMYEEGNISFTERDRVMQSTIRMLLSGISRSRD